MIPADKALHIAVGTIVGLVGAGVWLIAAWAGLLPLAGVPGAAALAGLIAGISKEGADYLDNKIKPGMHGVELLDAVATAAPGFLIGGVIFWLM